MDTFVIALSLVGCTGILLTVGGAGAISALLLTLPLLSLTDFEPDADAVSLPQPTAEPVRLAS